MSAKVKKRMPGTHAWMVSFLGFAAGSKLSEFEDIVYSVNKLRTTWTAAVPKRFASLDAVKAQCGSRGRLHSTSCLSQPYAEFLCIAHVRDPAHPEVGPHTAKKLQDLPTDFDSRVQWPNCTVIGHVRCLSFFKVFLACPKFILLVCLYQ